MSQIRYIDSSFFVDDDRVAVTRFTLERLRKPRPKMKAKEIEEQRQDNKRENLSRKSGSKEERKDSVGSKEISIPSISQWYLRYPLIRSVLQRLLYIVRARFCS